MRRRLVTLLLGVVALFLGGILAPLPHWAVAGGSAPPTEAGPPEPVRIALRPVLVPVMADGDRPALVAVQVTLVLADAAQQAAVQAAEPRLADTLLTRVHASAAAGRLSSATGIDQTRLEGLVRRATTDVVGPGVISALDIRAAVHRPM